MPEKRFRCLGIEAKLPTLPRTRDCSPLDQLISVLCRKGVLPPDLCRIGGHGGKAEFGEDGGGADGGGIPGGGIPDHGGGTPGGGGGVGPLAGAPSGRSRSDPIPLTWFKPLGLYPDPIRLSPSTGGVHDYEMKEPGQFVEAGHEIGVEAQFLPEVDKLLRLEHVLQDDDRGPAVDRFRSLLRRHGRPMTGEDADHVQDIGWGGDDAPENLWPLDATTNQDAGRAFQNFRITYAVNPGEAPRPETTKVRLGKASRASGPENIVGRFFIITGFERP